MNKHAEAFAEAQARRRMCADWLKTLMIPGCSKPATKAELCTWAQANLGVSKSSFDAGWVWAIEEMGRHDWYDPSPRRKTKLS
jgi:hypothetical protein